MKIAAAGASLLKGASATAIIIGAAYLVDCRLANRGADAINQCWMTALPIMGLGGAGGLGFQVGYQTYNPALRREDHQAEPGIERDEQGRFKRRQPP